MELDQQNKQKDEVKTTKAENQVKKTSLLFNWKLLLVFGVLVFSLILLTLFWLYGEHFVAVQSMNTWTNDVNGESVNCVFKDTDSNGYISCTAMVNKQLVPLECGTNIFNLGCRVSNYERQNIK